MNDAQEAKIRELVQNKQYTEARRLLEKLPNDPQARNWIRTLDGVMVTSADVRRQQGPRMRHDEKRSRWKFWLVNGLLFGSGAVLLYFILLAVASLVQRYFGG